MKAHFPDVFEKDPQEIIRQLQQELRQTNHEVLLLNLELEKRVDERTAELKAAYEELESFSYSVSHDLRAPLRAIDNFARILVEDFGPQLPGEAREHLERVAQGAAKMTKMIDELLRFSRFGREPIQKKPLCLSALVKDVMRELIPKEEGRQIDIQSGELPDCVGDAGLLKHVFANLISNALKFTRRKNKAVIRIGCMMQDGEKVYFVRDNGAGFDMQHAEGLFRVFQRLHPDSEFEGTGVGLSIVQRIIQRHGGRIWAEGVQGQGAAFYFTLPE